MAGGRITGSGTWLIYLGCRDSFSPPPGSGSDANPAAEARRAAPAPARPSYRTSPDPPELRWARPPRLWPHPASGRWTGLTERGFARRLPARRDQCVELCPHQLVVAEREIDEDVGLGAL